MKLKGREAHTALGLVLMDGAKRRQGVPRKAPRHAVALSSPALTSSRAPGCYPACQVYPTILAKVSRFLDF
jgi:hypothetical protein